MRYTSTASVTAEKAQVLEDIFHVAEVARESLCAILVAHIAGAAVIGGEGVDFVAVEALEFVGQDSGAAANVCLGVVKATAGEGLSGSRHDLHQAAGAGVRAGAVVKTALDPRDRHQQRRLEAELTSHSLEQRDERAATVDHLGAQVRGAAVSRRVIGSRARPPVGRRRNRWVRGASASGRATGGRQ